MLADGATKVNPPARVSVPWAVVTTTSAAPAVPAGVVTVILVAEFAVTVATAPPMVTVALAMFVPEIDTGVPPAVVPVAGLTDDTVGGLHAPTGTESMKAG